MSTSNSNDDGNQSLRTQDTQLFPGDVVKIYQIFTENQWFSKPNHDLAFERLIEMIVNFSDDQKNLIFDLCKRYLWVTVEEYSSQLINILNLIDSNIIQHTKRIILFPIAKPADIGKIKSSPSLIYCFNGMNFGGRRFQHIRFEIVDSYETLAEVVFDSNDILMLVDDFIGTGDTLTSTLSEIENKTLQVYQIQILALVAQENTILTLQKEGYVCHIGQLIKKGITDYYEDAELASRIETMTNLELLIPKNKRFVFGYGKSEALVTMNRTPNNTFPIFWRSHTRGSKRFLPPFPRHHDEQTFILSPPNNSKKR